MYKEPIFLEPVFKERIWGGTKLRSLFNYNIPSKQIGEAWVIAAHPNGSCTIKNGPYKGRNLTDIWEECPELFGEKDTGKQFPLLVKILDAADYLSVQVHPDDEDARKMAGEQFGKTECWYVLDCEEGAEIIFGHHALSKEQFIEMVEKKEWDRLLKRQSVKKGDFIYVPSGTIHAIGKGIVLLETQQNSDITYRVYDFDRKDKNGDMRELHINSAIDVTTFPHEEKSNEYLETTNDQLKMTRFIKTEYFTVYRWELSGRSRNPIHANYVLMTVINGEGEIEVANKRFRLTKGDNLIIPYTVETYEMEGNLELIVSHE